MLIALVVAIAAAVAGWGLWLVARRDVREARGEAYEVHERLRMADGATSAIRAREAAAVDTARAAESQVKVAAAELRALRVALALAEADRAALDAQVRALGSDPDAPMYDSAAHRMRLYGKRDT